MRKAGQLFSSRPEWRDAVRRHGGARAGEILRPALLQLIACPRILRKALIIGLDLLLCVAAVWLSYWLRLGTWELFSRRVLLFGLIATTTWCAVALVTRTYRSMTRFADAHTLHGLMTSCVLMSACLGSVLFWARIDGVPRTLSVIDPIVFFLLLACARLAVSKILVGALRGGRGAAAKKRLLIYGAGMTAQQLAASIRNEPGLELVGFVDANASLKRSLLQGRPIWHTSDLESLLHSAAIDEVVLAIPSLRRGARRAIVEMVSSFSGKVRVRALPTFSELASGRVTVSDLRDVRVEDLLGRDEVAPDPVLMQRDIAGRKVLVTGAGGSIGSELCRQILAQRPSTLVLAELSEFALYTIDMELRALRARDGAAVEIVPELVNVADAQQCARLLQHHRVDTVFHAAAYKHVPLVESNPISGIRNNVLGTLNTALASERSGVTKFILVSTDKAVRPTNVMGASKRACELIVQARAAAQQVTSYCSVRFGNVLGSSGSVIPHFRKQIASGGPVTITHRDATRYFMTIPEAAQLVIQAGALAGEGEILLLDMGDPVRISDLARLMIELSGLAVADENNPDGDIAIEEIGLRPGEKLIEELLIGGDCEGTAHPRIVKAREKFIAWDRLEPMLASLVPLLQAAASRRALEALRRLVPEFRPMAEEHAQVPGGAVELQSHLAKRMLGSSEPVQA